MTCSHGGRPGNRWRGKAQGRGGRGGNTDLDIARGYAGELNDDARVNVKDLYFGNVIVAAKHQVSVHNSQIQILQMILTPAYLHSLGMVTSMALGTSWIIHDKACMLLADASADMLNMHA